MLRGEVWARFLIKPMDKRVPLALLLRRRVKLTQAHQRKQYKSTKSMNYARIKTLIKLRGLVLIKAVE
jgi:hypothetical protein